MGDFGSSDTMLIFHVKAAKKENNKKYDLWNHDALKFFQSIVVEKQSGYVKFCLHQAEAKIFWSAEKHPPPRAYYEEVIP